MDSENHSRGQYHTHKDKTLPWNSKTKKTPHPHIKPTHTSTSQKLQTSHPDHQRTSTRYSKITKKDSYGTPKIILRNNITHKKTPSYLGIQNKKNTTSTHPSNQYTLQQVKNYKHLSQTSKTIHTSTSQKLQTSHPSHQRTSTRYSEITEKDSNWTPKIIHRHNITQKKTPFYLEIQNK